MEEETPDEEALETGIHQYLCTRQHAPNAAMSVKFHFGQAAKGRFTAVIVLKKEVTRLADQENQTGEMIKGQGLKKDVLQRL